MAEILKVKKGEIKKKRKKQNVVKFENINLGRGIKKYAILTDGLYVDADFISAESSLPQTTKKEKRKFNWAYFAIGVAVVGGVYLGGRRLFRKR